MVLSLSGCRCFRQDRRLPAQHAAQRRLRKGILSQSRAFTAPVPRDHKLDGHAASHRAVRELQEPGRLPNLTKLRSSKYLNNLTEQDHRNVKSRLGAMLGLKSFACAATTILGVELMHRIRKGQFDLRALTTQGQTPSKIWAAVQAA